METILQNPIIEKINDRIEDMKESNRVCFDLKGDLRKKVDAAVKSGKYADRTEVIRDAIRRLEV